MAENSKIEWTDHTFNPWWGCARVSPACRFCYADDQASRFGHKLWRRTGPRRILSDANWANPVRWNRAAERAGVPLKVFCASMADVFEDHPQLNEPRERLWQLIDATPHLRWQLLTKRPENVATMAPWGDTWPEHVWLGASAENQRFADQRLPILQSIPAKVRFISAEPLLGPLSLDLDGIDWVLIGGGSGRDSRPTNPDWVRHVVAQCQQSGTAPFVKQLGKAWGRENGGGPKGGDPALWPEDLRVREFPALATV